MLQVVLDVETKLAFEDVGGFFPEKLGISFVGVCIRNSNRDEGELRGYFEDQFPALFELLERADVIIGFNIDGFDMPALNAYYQADINSIPTLDLLDRIKKQAGHRISLDAVAQATLGIGKSGSGLDAIRYFREGNLKALKEYCLQDVAVTRDIYDYGLQKGHVKFRNKWNRLIECPVDFSFVPQKNAGLQLSLI